MANTLDTFQAVTVVNDTDLLHLRLAAGGANADKKITGLNLKASLSSGFTSIVDDETNGNYAIGLNALDSIIAGAEDNVCIGENAGTAITTGDSNICFGIDAGASISTQSDNVLIGEKTGENIVTNQNTIIGARAGKTMTSSSTNTALGSSALEFLTTGSNGNVAIGVSAMQFATSNNLNNIAIGPSAMGSAALSGGNYNVVIGDNAASALTSGDDNVLIGRNSGDAITTNSGAVAIGSNAFAAFNSSFGTAVGNGAGLTLTGGSNTVIGSGAGGGATAGITHCVFVGRDAGNLATGAQSTAVGYLAGRDSGQFGTYVGEQAAYDSSGTNNSVFGARAAPTLTTGNWGIFVGSNVNALSATNDDQLVIGNGEVNPISGYQGARSDVDYSGRDLTITGPSAYDAAVTNQDGGNLVLRGGQKATGGGVSGEVIAEGFRAPANINNQTGTTYTILASDNGKVITFDNAAAIAVTLPDTLDTNFHCTIVQVGAGVPTVTRSGTDTINGAALGVAPTAQWKGLYLAQYGAGTFLALI